jgi:tRNA (guanine6-N2)-methyltransferase
MNCYHVRTNPGLEPILLEELRELFPTDRLTSRPEDRVGWVRLDRADPVKPALWPSLRTAYEVVRVTGIALLPAGALATAEEMIAEITRFVATATLPQIGAGETFAVRCRRDGNHPLQSPLIEREVGAIVAGRTGRRVNLDAPAVTVRADLSGPRLFLAALETPRPLDRRFDWVYRPRITLSTVVAAATLRIATAPADGAPPPEVALLDPFCGSGTIAIEAAADGRWATEPVFASDLSPEAVAGARANAKRNGLSDRVSIAHGDALEIAGRYRDRGITKVVCNPPFGVRLGRRINFLTFYRTLLREVAALLPPRGRLVLLSSRRRGVLNRVIADSGDWRILSVHLIETGGVFPAIFALERRDVDGDHRRRLS